MQLDMNRNYDQILQGMPDALTIRQTMKGFFQTICGCDANEEFFVSSQPRVYAQPIMNMAGQVQNVAMMMPSDSLYVLENSDFCVRICCHSNRPMTLHVASAPGQPEVMRFERPLRCHVHSMKCCCFQEITAIDAKTGANIGLVKEQFRCTCVPKFAVFREDGSTEFILHHPTCCCGCCIDCSQDCSLNVPYQIFTPDDVDSVRPVGSIVKVFNFLDLWGNAHVFQVVPPLGASSQTKARLMAATFLLHQIFFQHHHRPGVDGTGGFTMNH